jgi:hypothetical protein
MMKQLLFQISDESMYLVAENITTINKNDKRKELETYCWIYWSFHTIQQNV